MGFQKTNLTYLWYLCQLLLILLYCFCLQPIAIKHFNLKRKPKAAAIKAELLQKAADAANNIKKHAAPTVPVRSRGMPRKMTDTSNFILMKYFIQMFLLKY